MKYVLGLVALFVLAILPSVQAIAGCSGEYSATCYNESSLFCYKTMNIAGYELPVNYTIDCPTGVCDNESVRCIDPYVLDGRYSMSLVLYIILFAMGIVALFGGYKAKKLWPEILAMSLFFVLAFQSFGLNTILMNTMFSGLTTVFVLLNIIFGFVALTFVLLGLLSSSGKKKDNPAMQQFNGAV